MGQLRFCDGNTVGPIQELEALRLWEPFENGWRVHDFLDFQPSKATVLSQREKSRKRQEKFHLSNAVNNAVNNGHITHAPTPVPTPNPTPTPKPKPKEKKEENDGFPIFWSRYRKKEGKGKAEESWKIHVQDRSIPIEVVLLGLEKWEKSQKWADGYVPMPTTWINQHRWEDEPEPYSFLSPVGRKNEHSGKKFLEIMEEKDREKGRS